MRMYLDNVSFEYGGPLSEREIRQLPTAPVWLLEKFQSVVPSRGETGEQSPSRFNK